MNVLTTIILISWLAFIGYWTITAKAIKPSLEVKRKVEGGWDWAGRIFFIFLFVESFGWLPIFPLNVALFPQILAVRWGSTLLVVLGLCIAILARRQLAGNWSWNIDIKRCHELMTTGIYGLSRHPIYTGIFLMSLGTFLFTGRLSSLIFASIMTAFMLFKAKEEEELLNQHFPDQYQKYRQRVSKLIPFIW